MAIVFDHAVKYNGKYYPAGKPIEEADKKSADTEQKVTRAVRKTEKNRAKGDA